MVPALALVQFDQVEAFADAAQHAQRQHVDLHHPDFVDVVLVPFDEGAVVHRSVADRHIFVEPVLGQDEAADMLRQVTRKLDQFGRKLHRAMDHGILGIETRLPHLHLGQAVAPASPNRIGEQRGDVLGQAERLADVADRAARTIMNDGGDDRCAVTAVTIEDILHHLFTARMLEIDIDIGRLAALFGEEAFEQKIDLGRIDGGDAEHEADGGIGRRSPTLTQDVLRPCKADDVVHGEEVVCVTEFFDQRQFLVQGGAQFVIDPAGKMFDDTLPCQIFQMSLRGLARRHRLVRIAIFQFVERKMDAAGEAQRLGDRIGVIAKQPRHFRRRFQMPLGIGLQQAARGFDGGLFADAADDILQHPPLMVVVQHVIGGEQRHAGRGGDALQSRQPTFVIAAMEQAGGEPDAIGMRGADRLQRLRQRIGREAVRRHQDQQQSFAEFFQVFEAQMTFAFFRSELAFTQQTAEPAITGAVARIGQDIRRAVDEDEARSDQEF
jgi:hypothetical protein